MKATPTQLSQLTAESVRATLNLLFFLCLSFSASSLAEAPRQSPLNRATNNLAQAPSKTVGADDQFSERRVLFDEDIEWATSPAATDRILARVQAAGFNVYVPCVWHGNGSYYPTSLVPPDPRVAKRLSSGEDPLAYLVERAHAMGIEIHPWFTVVRRENIDAPHLIDDGAPTGAFNVHNAAFRDFAVTLMLDVVRRYRIDGVNLDYIRSMGICRSEACEKDYRAQFGRSLSVDYQLSRLPGKRVESIENWNGQAVSAIVQELSTQAKRLRKQLIVSVDTHPLHPELLIQGQDSIKWANKGWIDVIYNMNYRPAIDVDTARRAVAALRSSERMTILAATFDLIDGIARPRDPSMINDYVRLTRRLWPRSGIAFYHRKQLSDAQITVLRENAFARTVNPRWPSIRHTGSNPRS